MTLPQGYNASRLKKAKPDLRIHYVQHDILEVGVQELKTPQGATVKAYNGERCICDLVKNQKKVEKQLFAQAIKTYFSEPYSP